MQACVICDSWIDFVDVGWLDDSDMHKQTNRLVSSKGAVGMSNMIWAHCLEMEVKMSGWIGTDGSNPTSNPFILSQAAKSAAQVRHINSEEIIMDIKYK